MKNDEGREFGCHLAVSGVVSGCGAGAGVPERTLERAKRELKAQSHRILVEKKLISFWYDPTAPWPANPPVPQAILAPGLGAVVRISKLKSNIIDIVKMTDHGFHLCSVFQLNCWISNSIDLYIKSRQRLFSMVWHVQMYQS